MGRRICGPADRRRRWFPAFRGSLERAKERQDMNDQPSPRERLRSSRRRYAAFVQDYKQRRLDDSLEAEKKSAPGNGEEGKAPETEPKRKGKRREYLREYWRWVWPHRFGVVALFLFAVAGAG